MQDLGTLLSEGAKLKARIDADKARLAEINRQLEAAAVFPEGKSTAHMAAGGFRATVTRKTYVKWDQKKLVKAMDAMGTEAFRKVFAYEFKPVSAKTLNSFLEFGNEADVAAVRDAMTETAGAPSVKYEEVLEDGG